MWNMKNWKRLHRCHISQAVPPDPPFYQWSRGLAHSVPPSTVALLNHSMSSHHRDRAVLQQSLPTQNCQSFYKVKQSHHQSLTANIKQKATFQRTADALLKNTCWQRCRPVQCSVSPAGASTPYKRWSKCTMKKNRGKGFCRNLGGKCVNYSCTSP